MPTDAPLLDARGEKCPLPVLRMEKRLDALERGGMLTVLATDPMAKVDIPLFCRQNGHGYALATEGGVMRFTIVKGAASA